MCENTKKYVHICATLVTYELTQTMLCECLSKHCDFQGLCLFVFFGSTVRDLPFATGSFILHVHLYDSLVVSTCLKNTM